MQSVYPLIYTSICVGLMLSFTFSIRMQERRRNRRISEQDEE